MRAARLGASLALCLTLTNYAQASWFNFLEDRLAPKQKSTKTLKKVTRAKVPVAPVLTGGQELDSLQTQGNEQSATVDLPPAQTESQMVGKALNTGVGASEASQINASYRAPLANPSNRVLPALTQDQVNVGKVQVLPDEALDTHLAKGALAGDITHFSGPIVFLAQSAEKSTVSEASSTIAAAPVNQSPPNMSSASISTLSSTVIEAKSAARSPVSFNAWSKEKGITNPLESMPDPQQEDESTWTKMEVSPDLPPRVAILGEDLIGAVVKQLPGERAKRLAMPYDEFKLRVRDAVLAFPDVGSAQSQLGYAQAGATESRAPLLPQINGFSESGKRKVGADSYLGTPAYSRDGTNYGVSVRQVIFDFGAALFGFQAGKAKERAAQELLNSKLSEQALKTVASVIDLERARAQMILAKDNVSSRLSIVKLVRERYELGGGSKPDIIRAESRYAEALATLTNAQNRLKASEAAYREAFAANPIGIIRGPNFEVPVDKLDATAEQLAGTYPGLQQLAQLRDSADADARAAFARNLPSLNFAYDNTINGVSAPLAPSRTINALLQLKYNFFTGGAETARKDQADFKAKQAEQEFQSGLRQYERVLTQNQEDVRNSDALLAARKVAATSAISSMRAVREQFAFNKGTLLDLLTVQESLFNAGRDLVDADADRQISRYRYLHLTSGLDRLFDLSESTYDVRSEVRAEVYSGARK